MAPDPPVVPAVLASLLELRVLEGPNLYFTVPAIKLTLDTGALDALSEPEARAFAAAVALGGARPGAPGSGQRQRFCVRALAHVLRRVAREAGTTRLGVRARAGPGPHRAVLAYPWRHRARAEALGRAVAEILDELGRGDEPTPGLDVAGALARAAQAVRASPLGERPSLLRPRVPVVSVTGTNGKTTTTRLLAHLGMCAGLRVGWSNTDGVYVQGELVEAGDWSGPGGARQVLSQPGVQLGVLETARGGVLLRGMGYAHNDVAIVTNVTADHLGMQGIDTLDQLAEVKAVVTAVTRPDGWLVLNGDDPRVLAMHRGARARPWVFSLDPSSPALREALDAGGRGASVLDGAVVLISRGADPDPVLAVTDIPLTLAGLSWHNLANVLAATAAASALGLPRAAIVAGLRSFRPDPEHNPGRMNLYSVRGITVVVDLAHNEASLEALLHVARGVRPPGAAVRTVVGSAGDRLDEVHRAMGEIAARGSDAVVIAAKDRYLRGRPVEELVALWREGAAAVGVHEVATHPSELAAVQALVAVSGPGDVVAVMCQAERVEVDAWLRSQGATVDDPDVVRAKVLAAR
jgi:cyanophycin synthetase